MNTEHDFHATIKEADYKGLQASLAKLLESVAGMGLRDVEITITAKKLPEVHCKVLLAFLQSNPDGVFEDEMDFQFAGESTYKACKTLQIAGLIRFKDGRWFAGVEAI